MIMAQNTKPLVLVTGGSGFIGAHCILALLHTDSYRIRTTVRSLSKSESVRTQLKVGGATEEAAASVEFAEVDLLKDKGWDAACEGCTHVLHVASPFPPKAPTNEDELIIPAKEGTLRALRGARKAGVRRVVVTSSVAAIAYGHDNVQRPFTEEDWSNVDAAIPAYPKSKTLAERAAWDYMKEQGGDMELAVVNPVAVYGPILGKEQYSTSVELIVRLMNGQMPAVPDIAFGVVDVRDVADLHLRAMTDPTASGQRFIATAGDGSMKVIDIAKTLKERLGSQANSVPTRIAPHFLVRILGMFDSTVKMIVPELGKQKFTSNKKAIEILGWQPKSPEDSVVSTAESLIRLKMVK